MITFTEQTTLESERFVPFWDTPRNVIPWARFALITPEGTHWLENWDDANGARLAWGLPPQTIVRLLRGDQCVTCGRSSCPGDGSCQDDSDDESDAESVADPIGELPAAEHSDADDDEPCAD